MARISDERITELVSIMDEFPQMNPSFWAEVRHVAADLRACRAERAELIEALRQTANLLYEAARAGWPIANIYSEGADAARALLEKLEGRPE